MPTDLADFALSLAADVLLRAGLLACEPFLLELAPVLFATQPTCFGQKVVSVVKPIFNNGGSKPSG
jgi:hypothetical protein